MDLAEFTVVLKLWGVDPDEVPAMAKELVHTAKEGYAAQDDRTRVAVQTLLDNVGLPWDMDVAPDVDVDELSFPEFLQMLSSGALAARVESWGEGCFHMRLFKNGFDTADVDGDQELTKDELHLAIGSIQSSNVTDEEFDRIWDALNPGALPVLNFPQFMDGMVRIKTDEKLGLADKFNLTKPNQLMSLIMDTPVAAWEHEDILSNFAALEKMGIKVLEAHNEEMTMERRRTLMVRANEGSIHSLHDGQREKLTKLHHTNVKQAFALGFISCFITSVLENILTWWLNTDGSNDMNKWNQTLGKYHMLDHNNPKDQERFLLFWAINGGALGICTGFEIAGLYYWGMKNSVRVANKLDMRLIPLNRVRATVAQSLIRAALELGQANDVIFGVDPLAEQTSKSTVIAALIAILYAAKIALTGFLMKVLVKRFMARGGAKYALPWMAVPACAGWNALVGNAIMREAKLRALGVAAGVELFNAFMEEDAELMKVGPANARRILKMQIIRAVACNIVKHRDFYPSKEVLLKHVMGYLNMIDEFKGSVGETGGRIDVPEDFLLDMSQLSQTEQKLVIKVLALCSILDGRVRGRERKFYQAAAEACNLPDNQHRMKLIAKRFRKMMPIEVEDFTELVEADPIPATILYHLGEIKSTCALCLAC
jgi:hypothetical protein